MCVNRYALCLTEEIVESFSRLYSENGSVQLTRAQRSMLFTSMVVQPESLMLKVCTRLHTGREVEKVSPKEGALKMQEWKKQEWKMRE